uniref:BTB domain-containing protein n=1 Tax=Panagrolaimus sp. ES5 TaxID=591445 RepID=A0AC34G7C0_9BILA
MVGKDIPKKAVTFEDHSVYLCLGLWNQDENKDFSIVADGKEITVHKCVLAVHSPVFARMFQSDLKEAQENKVIIEDFSFGIVEAAVKLCYHQSLITDITLDEKMKLIQFFDKYDIQSLKNDIESELISEIDETTVCQLANCSLLSNALNLKEKCAEFFQTCLNEKNHVTDLDILDEDFAYEMLQEAFFRISK